jgi:hypothetical protein
VDLPGIIRRVIERDQAAHAAFVAPPQYITDRNEQLCAEADEREVELARIAAHRLAAANARRERKEREELAARQREIDRQSRQLAEAIADSVVQQIRRPR